MKIIIAPDSFKGTMSANTVAVTVKEAFLSVKNDIDIHLMPMSDGGEGLTDIIASFKNCEKITKFAKGPNDDMVRASYLLMGDTAIIEMAQASGIMLTPKKKDPMHANTYGTGELICDAVRNGAKTVVLGIGGSATMDGGAGMAKALGFSFKDKNGCEITPCPKGLLGVEEIDDSGIADELKNIRFIIASDVKNTLCGKNGAAYVFGRQKGADSDEIKLCDKALERFACLLQNKYKKDLLSLEGGGAAGGIVLPLVSFFDAKIVSGADMLLDLFGFDEKIKNCDVVITGEGKIDSQSLSGKVPVAVAKRAKKAGVPVIVIAGDACPMSKELEDNGIKAVFSTNRRALAFKDARQNCKADLFETAKAIASVLTIK